MKTDEVEKMKIRTILFGLIILMALTTAEAQQKFKIAGSGDYTMIDGKAINIEDAKSHTMSLNEYEGNNISTGETEYMHNAQVVNISFNDVTKGNGKHQGYVTIKKGNDRIVSQWEGKITTTLSDEGKPITSFKGNMWWIEATGQYENMHGIATYKGHFTSENTYTVEWEGEYSKKDNKQANR